MAELAQGRSKEAERQRPIVGPAGAAGAAAPTPILYKLVPVAALELHVMPSSTGLLQVTHTPLVPVAPAMVPAPMEAPVATEPRARLLSTNTIINRMALMTFD